MNHYPHPILAREGWPFIGLSLVLSLLATMLWGVGFVTILFYLVSIFVIQFFRDPPRWVPEQSNAVLSPADGRIVKVEKVRDPYADRDALLISVHERVQCPQQPRQCQRNGAQCAVFSWLVCECGFRQSFFGK